jgi:hypothetical protein
MSALSDIRTEIARIDEEAERLDDARSTLTSRLERLALVWHKRYPEKPHDGDRLCCTAGRFVFDDIVDAADGGVLRFGTRCTWDGPDAAGGVVISAAWFERALQDEAEAQDRSRS